MRLWAYCFVCLLYFPFPFSRTSFCMYLPLVLDGGEPNPPQGQSRLSQGHCQKLWLVPGMLQSQIQALEFHKNSPEVTLSGSKPISFPKFAGFLCLRASLLSSVSGQRWRCHLERPCGRFLGPGDKKLRGSPGYSRKAHSMSSHQGMWRH